MQTELASLFSPTEIKHVFRASWFKILPDQPTTIIDTRQLLSESELLFFRSVVKRLKNFEPLQYILGTTCFYGLDIQCDCRALIPRPETEELVDWVLSDYKGETGSLIADVCTGTGCIALALKNHLPMARCIGVDVSIDALQLAELNAQNLELVVEWLCCDVLLPNWQPENWKMESFDCWVSNPPYVKNEEKIDMSDVVLNHEPHLALFAPIEDALLFYKKIADAASYFLKSKGHIYLELNENNAPDVVELLEQKGFVNIELRKDLQGKWRMIRAQKR